MITNYIWFTSSLRTTAAVAVTNTNAKIVLPSLKIAENQLMVRFDMGEQCNRLDCKVVRCAVFSDDGVQLENR